MEEEELRHSKQDHYLAQIAAEIRKTKVKNPNKVTLKDFLLKFKFRPTQSKKPSKPLTEEEKRKRLAISKAAWLSSVGIK